MLIVWMVVWFSPLNKMAFPPPHTGSLHQQSDSSLLQRLIGVMSDKVNAILQDAYSVIYQDIKEPTA